MRLFGLNPIVSYGGEKGSGNGLQYFLAYFQHLFLLQTAPTCHYSLRCTENKEYSLKESNAENNPPATDHACGIARNSGRGN